MTPLRTLIVDDEQLARRGLALRLKDFSAVQVVAECSDGQQALLAIAEHEPDLVFLDIQMPGMSGFDVIAHLQGDTLPMIVFVTAYDAYAVEAFKVHAVDYLLKPVEEERLQEAITRALEYRERRESAHAKERLVELVMGLTGASARSVENMASGNDRPRQWPEKISIRDGNDIHLIRVDDIRWIDAAGDYMCLHTATGTHIMRSTLKQLEAMLDPQRFVRVHRSTIVNARDVVGAHTLESGDLLLHLGGDARVKVSRGFRERARELLEG